MKAVRCPSCGAEMKRNGKTSAGSQRWRCGSCGASATLSYDDTAARLGEFLAWLASKDTQLSMPGQGRTFRRRTAEFWRVWPMPAPTGEVHRVLFVDGIWLARDLVVLIAHDGEHVVSWYMAQSETSRAWGALMAPIPAPDVVVCDGGTGFEGARRRVWPRTRVQRCLFHAFCQVRRYMCGKRVEVKESQDDLSVTMPDRDAVIYKMHGDASHPAKCVITKDDYESYMVDRRLFVTSLQGDLITKTFLFIGFSFSDPNFSAILGRLRILLDENVRTHYCLLKRACRSDKDLARYGIRPVLLEGYGEVPQVLNRVRTMVRCRTVFISGSAAQYGPTWERDAVSLVYKLTRALLRGGYRVVTGHGRGVGSYVISAAIDELGVSGLDGRLIIQAFPYEETRRGDYRSLCRSYREGIAKRAGVGLYLFGNKLQGSDIVSADGMLEEYELLRSEGSLAIPVASTGFAAEKIFALEKKRGTLLEGVEELDDEMNVSRIIEIILSVLERIQRGEIPRR